MTTPSSQLVARVRHEAKDRASAIFTDQQTLFNILERYELTLRKRWTKKSAAQRVKLLLAVQPGMASQHRPDFQAFRREPSEQTMVATRYHDWFLLSSINLEDLKRPQCLLLFMNSRGRTKPGVFVKSDYNSINLGVITRAIKPLQLPEYIMLLHSQDDVTQYGRLLSWAEDAATIKMMAKGSGIEPGEGLLVLEAQERKIKFLLKCAKAILHDLPINDMTVPRQPEPEALISINEHSEWPSLTNETLEAQYRTPDQFDVSRLKSFIDAQRTEAEDHIWSLREDPLYLQQSILEWSEHRQEKNIDTDGKTHPLLGQDRFWQRVIFSLVHTAYSRLLLWDTISKDVEHLVTMRSQYGDKTGPESDLPEAYKHALCHFSHLIEQAIKAPLGLWRGSLSASSALRNHFERKPYNPNEREGRLIVRSKSDPLKDGDHFLWLVLCLMMDDEIALCGLENLLDELERLIRSDLPSRERLSPWLARVLSQLSLLAEIKRQIGLIHPGPSITEALPVKERQDLFESKIELDSKITIILYTGLNFVDIGTPLSKFDYPGHKRRTAAVTKQLQEAEGNLDRFWHKIDDHCFKASRGKTLHQLFAGVLEQRELQRTPSWTGLDRVQEDQDSDVQAVADQISTTDLEERTEKAIAPDSVPEKRVKTKTRGVADESKAGSSTEPQEPPTDVEPQRFTVSKRGFKVFATLFFMPSEKADPPGELPWSEFLSAMASVGFSVKSLDGSAWVFTPTTNQLQRSIIFHEPHPSSKLPFQVARRYGRRLQRTYGWTAETFVRG